MAASIDVDVQAVEGIPRETLVQLLKRKDKDAKATAQKLEKLEERYVKVVRFNKIVMEDRASFLRFCNELLPESDAAFEEAAAQEVPVNIEALLRRLGAWRGAFEGARDDRRVFQRFVELIFPGDDQLRRLFDSPVLGADIFDTLQQRWMGLEDLHNQSIASINGMAREQVMDKTKELDELQATKREADRRIEELREELQQFAKERAHATLRKLQGGPEEAVRAASPSAGVAAPGDAIALREARELCRATERREAEAKGALEAMTLREQDTQRALEANRSEMQRLQADLAKVRDDQEENCVQTRQLLADKEQANSRLQSRLTELEHEVGTNSFIERFAEQQAGRDAELRRAEQLGGKLAEAQRTLTSSQTQESALKQRVQELEQMISRGPIAQNEYLKHVVMKYLEYSQRGDMKSKALVPVISTLLSLSSEERRLVEQPSVPLPLLYLNQACGEASSWFRGDPDAAGRREVQDLMLGAPVASFEDASGSAAA